MKVSSIKIISRQKWKLHFVGLGKGINLYTLSNPMFNLNGWILYRSLWLYCGAHGMRVWLPVFPREGDHGLNFMSKRIMLHFPIEKFYPLGKTKNIYNYQLPKSVVNMTCLLCFYLLTGIETFITIIITNLTFWSLIK